MTAGSPPASLRRERGGGGSGDGAAEPRYRPASDDDEAPSDDDTDDDDVDDDDADDRRSRGRRLGNLTSITVEASGVRAGRVGVHVDGGAEYAVARRGGGEVVITLFSTRADSLAVRRVVDARTLGGRVLRVLPTVDDDRGQVTLTVETRGASKIAVTEADGVLWIGFVDEGEARGGRAP